MLLYFFHPVKCFLVWYLCAWCQCCGDIPVKVQLWIRRQKNLAEETLYHIDQLHLPQLKLTEGKIGEHLFLASPHQVLWEKFENNKIIHHKQLSFKKNSTFSRYPLHHIKIWKCFLSFVIVFFFFKSLWLMNVVKCLTYTVKQLSSRAVFQEEVHSWTLFPMPKKTHNVGMAE